MRLTTRSGALLAVACGCALASASPAAAAVSETSVQVTSPAGTYLMFDEVSGAESMTVAGTSNGKMGEKVDINCYAGTKRVSLAQGVELQSGGTFSFRGSFRAIDEATCTLRAVPHGITTDYPPGSPSPYSGPTLAIGRLANAIIEGGESNGALAWYHLAVSGLAGAFDYRSLGNCTILDSYTYDPVKFGTFETAPKLDDCNATLGWKNGATGVAGIAPPKRSELQVDGVNAYLPGNAAFVFATAAADAGFPTLKYGFEVDPSTGDLVLVEEDEAVKCAPEPATYPPTPASCSSFVPAGVAAYLRITQEQSGRVASVTQFFYSTDGAAHSIDLLEQNQFAHVNADGELDFPWITGAHFAPYTEPGEELPAAAAAPGSLFVKGSASVPDGGEGSAQGSLTFSNAPEGETIVGSTINNESWVNLHYRRTVPAEGSVALGFTYSNAFLLSEVEHDAAAAQAAYLPGIMINGPASGTSTSQPQVAVSGTASDRNGLASLIVNGASVPVENGAWSANVHLAPGANTITATATNVFGYTAHAQVVVTYVPETASAAHALQLRGRPHASGNSGPRGASFTVSCEAPVGQSCTGVGALTSIERRRGSRVLAITSRTHKRRKPVPIKRVTVTVGERGFSVPGGQTATIFVGLNAAGRALLSRFHNLPVTLAVTLTNGASGAPALLTSSKLTIKPAKKARKKHHGHAHARKPRKG